VLMQRIVARFPDQHLGPNKITSDPLWRSPFAPMFIFMERCRCCWPWLERCAIGLRQCGESAAVRSVGRRREMAIRLSMARAAGGGAATAGGESADRLAGGAVCADAHVMDGHHDVGVSAFTTLPLTLNGHVDASVFLATLLVSVFTALVAGAIPALRASGSRQCRAEGRVVKHFRRPFQIASYRSLVMRKSRYRCCCLLARGCSCVAWRMHRTRSWASILTTLLTTYDLDPMGYTGATGREFDRQLLARVKALPGVQSATLADFAPLNFTIHSEFVQPEGYVPRPHESMEVDRARSGPAILKRCGRR